MRHWHRILAAMTALVALACSAGVGATLWGMWRHPVRARVICDGDRARWSALGCAWELLSERGEFRQLLIRPLGR